jgi:hypothetical protein
LAALGGPEEEEEEAEDEAELDEDEVVSPRSSVGGHLSKGSERKNVD